MKLSRNVGTTSQILNLFVQDSTVTTGAGLANVVGSSVSYTWFRNNQAVASTGTASTAGTTGTYSTSAWTQVNSSRALGWYQFGAPDGIFFSGDAAGIHFYVSSGPSAVMVDLPVEIELTRWNNQTFASSVVFADIIATTATNLIRILGQPVVTSGAGILNVSTQTIDKGGYGVTSVAGTTAANVIQIYGSAAVTSGAGIFNVSTQTIDKSGYGVTSVAGTTRANVIEAYGSAIVTSAAGQFRVSTQAIDKGGYGVTSVAFYGTLAVTSGAGILNVSTQTLTAGAAGGDISSVYGQPIVTSGAGILTVSTQTLGGGSDPGVISSAVWAAPTGLGKTTLLSLAEINAVQVLRVSTLQAGSTAQSLVLDASATSIDDFYNRTTITIVTGPAAGQNRLINDYDGATKTAFLDRPLFSSVPAAGNFFAIDSRGNMRSASDIKVGLAQGATVSTITLANEESSANDFYNRMFLLIESGLGEGQSRMVDSYAGASRTAQVGRDWVVTPNSTSRYVILPFASVKVSQIDPAVITSTEAPSLANLTNPLTEGYRTNGATGTMAQLMYEMVAHMGETSITGTTKIIRAIDHTATAATFTLNSTTPSAITRTT